MMATVRIPPVLRKHTGNEREVESGGSTVGEVLRSLTQTFPPLNDQLFQNGSLQRYVNIYVNDQDIQYLQKLDTPVADRDTVIILPAMAGGDQ
jgi:molybdopterin synthase sulfur carrier subunit